MDNFIKINYVCVCHTAQDRTILKLSYVFVIINSKPDSFKTVIYGGHKAALERTTLTKLHVLKTELRKAELVITPHPPHTQIIQNG